MQIITAAVTKGGTGKTATTGTLAQAAAYRGRRVLAIDLDAQQNLSFVLGATAGPGSDLLLAGKDPAKLIQHTAAGIDVIPGSYDLAAETSSKGSARRLQKALEPLKERYDLIFIDVPPSPGELQLNALQAATGLIIPLLADAHGVQALYQITRTAQQIQATSNTELEILGFILTQHNPRSTIAKQMQEILTERAAAIGVPYLGAVRQAVAIREAAALQKSLFEYAPNCKPAQDYLQIFDALKI